MRLPFGYPYPLLFQSVMERSAPGSYSSCLRCEMWGNNSGATIHLVLPRCGFSIKDHWGQNTDSWAPTQTFKSESPGKKTEDQLPVIPSLPCVE